ncbi:nucleoside phosphorylase domain-containing protein [Aspergillus germanicus]
MPFSKAMLGLRPRLRYDVARALLDEEHDNPFTPRGDPNSYTVGRIGGYNVVIVKSIRTGSAATRTAAIHIFRTFNNIRFGLLVGIGGGAADAPGSYDPGNSTTDILLGDVVVSKPEGNHGGVLHPPDHLISAVDQLSRDHGFKRGNMAEYIMEAQSKLEALGMSYYHFPGRHQDILFKSEYNQGHCRSCDSAEIARTLAPRNDPLVHRGLIASGNTDCWDAEMRDTMRRDYNAIYFDTEEATLMNNFPCLAIRGVSDYADSHKNRLWQPYAALTATAYAKDLLGLIEPQEIVGAGTALTECTSNPRLHGGGAREDRMLLYPLSDSSTVLGGYVNVAREV